MTKRKSLETKAVNLEELTNTIKELKSKYGQNTIIEINEMFNSYIVEIWRERK